MPSLISVIIPVYNHETALRKTLASLALQTYQQLEAIVVDDGSAPAVAVEPADFHFSVSLIRQDHAGAPSARNRGLREAKGEYVIFWDADVIADREVLEKMEHVLTLHPEASYAYSSFIFGKKKMPARRFDAAALKQANFIHTTSLIRREAIVPWDESLKKFQDWDLWLTMLEKGNTGIWIPEYLFHVTRHQGGMSQWLPKFAYQPPWKWLPGISQRVRQYEEAKTIILKKHSRT